MNTELEKYLIPIAVAAVSVLLSGTIVWWFQGRLETLRKERERLHEVKRKVYLDLLEPFIMILASNKLPGVNEKAMKLITTVEYRRTATDFILVADDAVVLAYNKLMQNFYNPEVNARPFETMHLWGDLLIEIRKSFGNGTTKLTSKDALEGWITDINNVFPKK